MAATYEIRLSTDRSERIDILGSEEWSSFNTTRVINGVGTLELVLPYGAIDPALLKRDYLISILRSIDGGSATLLHDQVYLIQTITFEDQGGSERIVLRGVDCNDLLRRRIIAYYTRTAQTERSTFADNIIKAIVRENLGATASDYAASTLRGIPVGTLVIDANTSQAPVVSRSFAWRGPMIDTLRDIANDSRQLGTYLAFDLSATPGAPLTFRTYTGQRGTDRRGEMLPLSKDTGTLNNPRLTYDYSDEKTAVYAGGRGEEDDRIVQTATDTARAGLSLFGRVEDFVYSQGETVATVLADAQSQLTAKRPRIVFSADFTDSPAVQYGREIGFGDQVQASAFGRSFDCRIDAVQLGVSSEGLETVGINLRSEASQ